uniref:Uncharacterized protein n=1 Tax=Arundo donax TaxID=35708 RepID=A0A0A8YV44_ARUDO
MYMDSHMPCNSVSTSSIGGVAAKGSSCREVMACAGGRHLDMGELEPDAAGGLPPVASQDLYASYEGMLQGCDSISCRHWTSSKGDDKEGKYSTRVPVSMSDKLEVLNDRDS